MMDDEIQDIYRLADEVDERLDNISNQIRRLRDEEGATIETLDDIVDPRVDFLIDEYNRSQFLSEQLGISNTYLGYSVIAKDKHDELVGETPILPKISSYQHGELKATIANIPKGYLPFEVYEMAFLFDPVVAELDVLKTVEIRLKNLKMIDVTYMIIQEGSHDYGIYMKLDTGSAIIEREMTVSERDLTSLELRLFQYRDKDVLYNAGTKDAADDSFETYECEETSKESIVVHSTITLYTSTVEMNEQKYVDPLITSELLFERENQERVSEWISATDINIVADEESALDDFVINIVELRSIIAGETPKDYGTRCVDYYDFKKFNNFSKNVYLSQSVSYKAASYELIEESRTYEDVPSDKLLIDTTSTLASVTDTLTKVNQWEDIAKTLSGSAMVQPELDIINIEAASKVKQGVSEQLQIEGNKPVNPNTTYATLENSQSTPNQYATLRLEGEAFDANKTNIDSRVAVLDVTDDIITVISYTVTAEGNGNRQHTEDEQAITSDRTMFRIIESTSSLLSTNNRRVTVTGKVRENGFNIPYQYSTSNISVVFKSIVFLDRASRGNVSNVTARNGTFELLYMDKHQTVTLNDGKPAQVTLDEYGTLFGVGFELNMQLTYNMQAKVAFMGNKNFSDDVKKLSNITRVPPNMRNVDYFSTSDSSSQLQRLQVTTSQTSNQSYPVWNFALTINKNAVYDSMALPVGMSADYATFNNGKTIKQEFDESNKDQRSMYAFCLRNFAFKYSTDVTYQRETAPVNLTEVLYLNQYTTAQDKINWQVQRDIMEINNRLEDIDSKIENIYQTLAMIENALNPPMWQSMLESILGAIVNKVASLALEKGLKLVVSMIGKMNELANQVWASTKNGMKAFRKQRGSYYPHKQVGASASFVHDVASALDKTIILKSHQKQQRPAYKNTGGFIQNIDQSEKIDITLGVLSRGRFKDGVNHDFIRPEFGTRADSIPLPEFGVFYRPLDSIPAPLNMGLHKGLTVTDTTRKQMLAGPRRAGILKPSHSFATFEDYKVLPNGTIEKELTLFGVGEFGNGNKASSIGGVHVKYHSNTIDKSSGTRVYYPTTYAENGYNANDVDRLHKSLYKNNKKVSALSPEEKWTDIVNGVDNRVQTSDSVYRRYVPDTGIGEAYKDMVDSQLSYNYSLFSNNCQSFTNSLINYHDTGVSHPSWPTAFTSRLNGVRINFVADEINRLPPIMSRNLDATSDSLKLIVNKQSMNVVLKRD